MASSGRAVGSRGLDQGEHRSPWPLSASRARKPVDAATDGVDAEAGVVPATSPSPRGDQLRRTRHEPESRSTCTTLVIVAGRLSAPVIVIVSVPASSELSPLDTGVPLIV
jgi:hypothetical protein